jgi:hypothetical protein
VRAGAGRAIHHACAQTYTFPKHTRSVPRMGAYSRKPFYGVAKGRSVGVFTSWYPPFVCIPILTVCREDCKESVNGYPGAVFKGFNNRGDATSFISGYMLFESTNRNSEQTQREDTVPLADPEPSPLLRTQMPRSFQAREALHNSTVARNNQPSTFSRNNSARTVIDLETDELDDEYASQPPSSDPFSSPLSNTRKRGRSANEYHAKRPSPGERDIIDLTDSPPKRSSHAHVDPHDFPPSPPSPPERPLPGSYPRGQLFADAECSDEQLRILDLVAKGRNVFFTGSAGVGKSFVLNKISELLKSEGLKQFDDFFITASTGAYPPLTLLCLSGDFELANCL